MTERYNSTLLTMLKFYVNESHSDWAKYVNMVTFVHNTSVNSSTGYTPFFLVHGFEATQPIDLAILPRLPDHDVLKAISALHEIRTKLPEVYKTAQEKQKRYYDEGRREISFKVSEKVLVRYPFVSGKGTKKLAPLYKGPFKVTKVISPLSYELELLKGGNLTTDTVHVSRLKKFYDNK